MIYWEDVYWTSIPSGTTRVVGPGKFADGFEEKIWNRTSGEAVVCSVDISQHISGFTQGYEAGYAAAKAEMLSKLDTFSPTYVEGGRVPEDAIEHRNQPRAKE